ncbi:cytoglobin-2-like isoform X2 [Acropora muricata]|uniref:cytoglobin-2-like isoform X2 n=1 Tax=Acropora millepora TaxID=45264 RepID=UPI001CF38A54|nr:cytoglobin-2-like isoform X2 [Acropora millepora]
MHASSHTNIFPQNELGDIYFFFICQNKFIKGPFRDAQGGQVKRKSLKSPSFLTGMGCSSSVAHKTTQVSLPLSETQKYLVRETWETVEQHKNNVGKKTFLRFFQKNPEYQKLFPEFKDVDPSELEKTSALHGHAKRVMKAVENAVSSLDDAFSFAAYLEELGRRHKSRALKPIYLDAMQESLMSTLKELLNHQWTSETEDAWNRLFHFISSTMIKGLQSQ